MSAFTLESALSFVDPFAPPGEAQEVTHLLHGLFQPKKPFRRCQPQPEPDVMAASPLKIPAFLLAVGLARESR